MSSKQTQADINAANKLTADAITKASQAATQANAFPATPGPIAPKSGEAPGITKRGNSYYADPTTLCDGEAQVRFDYGDLEELGLSITTDSRGILNPIRVKRLAKDDPRRAQGKEFEQLGGHRRMAAVNLLIEKHKGDWRAIPGLAVGVPIIIDDKDMNSQEAVIRMFIDNAGKPLLPLEEADAYNRLRQGDKEAGIKGMTIAQICKAVGRSSMHVTGILQLLDLDDEVKEDVKAGRIGKIQAREIAKTSKGDKEKQKAMAATAKKAKAGDKAAKVALDKDLDKGRRDKAAKKGKTLKMRALSDVELGELGRQQQEHLKTLLAQAGKPLDFDLRDWVSKDDKLALAAAFGALEALKAAAGMTINLAF